jgi:glycosyltransferase involved in cell wall biosynthesis
MNIGIDAKRIFFNNSGLGNYGRRFYHALAKRSAGDKFYLFAPKAVPTGNAYLDEMISDKSTIITPDRPLYKIMGGAFWRSGLINKQLQKDKIDIYYGLSNEIPFGTRKINTAMVVVIHDLIFLRYPELYPAIDVFFYKKKTKYACEYADYVIAASEQTRQDIVNFYNISPDKITVLYPSSDPMFYSENIADSHEFFAPERRYIISIGAITPRKNLLKTVQALNVIKNKYELDLVIIGTAVGMGRDYLKTIKDFIAKNNLSDRVHFLGNVPYKYVPGLCRNAELMVYPSQFEGFGMPIVEGLFSKIPVITSKGGCFPEAGGNGAIYVNPDDHDEITAWIEKLMDSPSLRDDLIRKGYNYAEKFRQEHLEDDIIRFHSLVKASV